MALDVKFIAVLADAAKSYFSDFDLREFCSAFDVELPYGPGNTISHLAWARSIIQNADHGNNRRFLESIVGSLVSRAREGVAHTDWERRNHHQSMLDLLTALEEDVQNGGIPSEISVQESRPFIAKSEAREFFGQAETDIMIVDNYVGAGTLDCLRDAIHPISLLTGQHSSALANDFERALRDFRTEGRSIEVRRHARLHDRYILFNKRCWLAGSSLKDAGKKSFNIIEVVDSRAVIEADVSKKWSEAEIL